MTKGRKNEMLKGICRLTVISFIVLLSYSHLYAQEEKSMKKPPANVVVAKVKNGLIAPESEFIGTVYYQEVSDIAAEVSGSVESVMFEEGHRVKKEDVLVHLKSDLIGQTLKATIASYEQILSDLERARIDLKRAENLRREELISEQRYDLSRFLVQGLEKKAESLKAEVERLQIEIQKTAVKVPYDGVVVKKHIDRGEWLSPGDAVATIAKDDVVDIVVEVPEGIMKAVRPGTWVRINTGGKVIKGKVFAVIPQADISTRTFPVKIRIDNSMSLIEGMEAQVTLPSGIREKTLTVSRDAVITMFGQTVVFAVTESKAKMIPVTVIGYSGKSAGIRAEGLQEGMQVVVKGNERLRDGQEVNVQGEKSK
jgi:RND family efflux transporter MFP subunit